MIDVVNAMEEVEKDPEFRVVIVTGAGGKHFCGGADLRDFAERARAGEEPRRAPSAAAILFRRGAICSARWKNRACR